MLAKLALLSTLLPPALASPQTNNSQTRLQWDGAIFPDRPSDITTLSGDDITDIWDQVFELNPSFDPWIPTPDAFTTAIPKNPHPDGPLSCGSALLMATGNWYTQNHTLELLYGLGGSWPVDASQCLRLGCSETTGLYWCNDNAWGIRAKGWYLHAEAKRVMYHCCKYSVLQGPDYAVAGMASFPDDSKDAAFSRVVLGYADCHDPLDTDPLKYGYPGDDKACKETGKVLDVMAMTTTRAVL